MEQRSPPGLDRLGRRPHLVQPRSVPTLKDIGVCGEKGAARFADMGAIEFANVDCNALLEQDARAAAGFDAGVFVAKSIG
jgi:hypothetical protein